MQVEFTENLEFAWMEDDSSSTIGYLHNHGNGAPVRAPRSLTFEASKAEYGTSPYSLLSTVVEWDELRCI